MLVLYGADVAALDRAVKIDEVKRVRDVAEQIKLSAPGARHDHHGEGRGPSLARYAQARHAAGKGTGGCTLAKRGQPKKTKATAESNLRGAENTSKPLSLPMIGLTHNESAEAQKLDALARGERSARERTIRATRNGKRWWFCKADRTAETVAI